MSPEDLLVLGFQNECLVDSMLEKSCGLDLDFSSGRRDLICVFVSGSFLVSPCREDTDPSSSRVGERLESESDPSGALLSGSTWSSGSGGAYFGPIDMLSQLSILLGKRGRRTEL